MLYAVLLRFSKQLFSDQKANRLMCGRFTLSTPAAKLMELFQLTDFPRLEPRYNVAPSQWIACIREDPKRQREAVLMRWGLVPAWAKDASIGNRMINARSETAAEKPSFRRAFAARRCLVPVDGFYEWEKVTAQHKQPWLIRMQSGQPFALAGLWEAWTDRNNTGGEQAATPLLSCTILTTAANSDMQAIHDRMPVVIAPEAFKTWLSAAGETETLQPLMQPLPEGLLRRDRVSTIVNKPVNDTPDCLVPLESESSPEQSSADSLFD